MKTLKEKLTSRKLWAALLAAVGAIVAVLFGDSLTAEVVGALKCAVTALIAYIFGEGAVDVARLISDAIRKAKTTEEQGDDMDEPQETQTE